jgi:3-keto-disaccharide hydrolase
VKGSRLQPMKALSTLFPFALCATVIVNAIPANADDEFIPLFRKDGVPEGWVVRAWNDVKNPPVEPTVWKVEKGILHGGEPRGSWLMSEEEYGDFILEWEFKLSETGNSGCALRAPMRGDPAFDGMEVQMADFRYNPQAKDSELTGGIYRAIAPTKQVYKPTEWNRYQVSLKGSHLKVVLNGETIQDLNLDEQNQEVKRHDGKPAPPVKNRPRKGHIGFQELSRGDSPVQIRNARIKVLD